MKPLTPVAVKSLALQSTPEIRLASLEGMRLERWILVIFKDGMTAPQWRDVLNGANQLSTAMTARDDAMEAHASEEEIQKHRDEIDTLMTGDYLEWVASFRLWTADMTPKTYALKSSIKGLALDTGRDRAIKGGLGQLPELSSWQVKPADLATRNYLPYYSVRGHYAAADGAYDFELQLRPEPPRRPGQMILKGDIVLDRGSSILDQPYGEPVPSFKFGYAEILLSLPPSP